MSRQSFDALLKGISVVFMVFTDIAAVRIDKKIIGKAFISHEC